MGRNIPYQKFCQHGKKKYEERYSQISISMLSEVHIDRYLNLQGLVLIILDTSITTLLWKENDKIGSLDEH